MAPVGVEFATTRNAAIDVRERLAKVGTRLTGLGHRIIVTIPLGSFASSSCHQITHSGSLQLRRLISIGFRGVELLGSAHGHSIAATWLILAIIFPTNLALKVDLELLVPRNIQALINSTSHPSGLYSVGLYRISALEAFGSFLSVLAVALDGYPSIMLAEETVSTLANRSILE